MKFEQYIDLFQKLSELMLRPWQQGVPLSSLQGSLMLALLKPSISLVKATLSYLIMARGQEVSMQDPHPGFSF